MPAAVRALLLTDVVDSTALALALGDARMAQVWAAHDRIARDLLVVHHGREIDKTDGFLLLFDSARDAAAYALAYHRAIGALEPPLSARVGLHVAEVILTDNPAADIARGAKPVEVDGLAKPTTARIMALATGRQTLLSDAARTALAAQDAEVEIRSHGHYRLKGLAEPMELFEAGLPGESPFTPPPDSAKAYRVVRSDVDWRPARDVPHVLPAELDAFVGRGQELQALAQRLDDGERLLTVLGMGGTGKTRLVCRYGRTWLGDWPGGVFFCDLSEARSESGIASAVAAALDVPLGKDDPVVQLGHAIAGRGRCLILLDNFEQVTAHAVTTVLPWLQRARDASFVVTSRETLALPGEQVLALQPLPADGAGLELFAVRARARDARFELTASNRQAVQDIVALLDGLPLAIELAAARTTVLAPEQLLARLKDRFQILVGARGARARHATLRATIDWSWALLAPWEQAALAQASVFVGGFTLPAAEQVLDLAAWPEAPPVLDVVQALVDKSLLRTWMPGGGARLAIDEPYFGMYVSIHEYAQAKLRADEARPADTAGEPTAGATAARHGRYFAGYGTEAAVEALDTHGGVARRRALGLELENLVAACRRAQDRGDAPTAVATFAAASGVLGLKGPFDLAVTLGRPVLALTGLAPADRARAMVLLADALRLAGQMDEALGSCQDAIRLAREHGQRRLEGIALSHLGLVHTDQGRKDEAMQHALDALAIHREVGNRRFECVAELSLGGISWYQGRMEASLVHNQAALAIAREVGDRSSEGIALSHLGILHSVQGRLQEALRDYRDALAILREVGDRRSECSVLNNLGFADQGRLPGARQHYEDALAISREVGYRRIEAAVLDNLGDLHRAQGRPDEAMRHYQDAVAIARELGDRRSEGLFAGSLGLQHARQGRFEPAREALAAGEALLRAVNDRWQLGILLCRRGECEHLAGNPSGARDCLAEAEGLAQDLAAGPDAEIGQAIGKLRALLAGASPAPGI